MIMPFLILGCRGKGEGKEEEVGGCGRQLTISVCAIGMPVLPAVAEDEGVGAILGPHVFELGSVLEHIHLLD